MLRAVLRRSPLFSLDDVLLARQDPRRPIGPRSSRGPRGGALLEASRCCRDLPRESSIDAFWTMGGVSGGLMLRAAMGRRPPPPRSLDDELLARQDPRRPNGGAFPDARRCCRDFTIVSLGTMGGLASGLKLRGREGLPPRLLPPLVFLRSRGGARFEGPRRCCRDLPREKRWPSLEVLGTMGGVGGGLMLRAARDDGRRRPEDAPLSTSRDELARKSLALEVRSGPRGLRFGPRDDGRLDPLPLLLSRSPPSPRAVVDDRRFPDRSSLLLLLRRGGVTSVDRSTWLLPLLRAGDDASFRLSKKVAPPRGCVALVDDRRNDSCAADDRRRDADSCRRPLPGGGGGGCAGLRRCGGGSMIMGSNDSRCGKSPLTVVVVELRRLR